MPIALDPNATCPASLDVDKDKPEVTRPTFILRFLTRREVSKLAADLDKARDIEDYEAGHAALDQCLAVGVTGWRNMTKKDGTPAVFGVDAFDDILTGSEKWELAQLQITAPRLAERDRPLSGSRSASTTASSAVPAAPPENASTSQAP